jgi:chromosome segregation ATPase
MTSHKQQKDKLKDKLKAVQARLDQCRDDSAAKDTEITRLEGLARDSEPEAKNDDDCKKKCDEKGDEIEHLKGLLDELKKNNGCEKRCEEKDHEINGLKFATRLLLEDIRKNTGDVDCEKRCKEKDAEIAQLKESLRESEESFKMYAQGLEEAPERTRTPARDAAKSKTLRSAV